MGHFATRNIVQYTGRSRHKAGVSVDDISKPYVPGHAAEGKREREVAAQVEVIRAQARARALRRCDVCRYLLTRCCCPGGPRGGTP